ncbi:tetratricopeptide repeat protein [Tautonia plasticadhaerens]|uniref:hypothetical protein n=1 Tax=Tautonia plasticadhaerens TaxID=2527974 RepID=UPI0011A0BDAD|nr:hypothetical protein [Tautonia plasticadhaerens]
MGEVVPSSISVEEWIRARRQKYLYYSFLSLLVLVLCLVALAAFDAGREQELERLRDDISATGQALRDAIDREKRIIAVSHEAYGQARAISYYRAADGEIGELTRKLKMLVEEFKGRSNVHKGLSEAEARRIRLAKAIIADAGQRYGETLRLLTREDASKALSEARESRQHAVRLLMTRAHALHLLFIDELQSSLDHKVETIEEELRCYRDVLSIDPLNATAKSNAARCHDWMGREEDAAALYNEIFTKFRNLRNSKNMENELLDYI